MKKKLWSEIRERGKKEATEVRGESVAVTREAGVRCGTLLPRWPQSLLPSVSSLNSSCAGHTGLTAG